MDIVKLLKVRNIAVSCVAFISLVCNQYVFAVSSEQPISEKDKQIEQMLDELIGDDPSIISADDPMEAKADRNGGENCCELLFTVGHKNNVLGSSVPDLDSGFVTLSLDYGLSSDPGQPDNWGIYLFYEQTAFSDLEVDGSVYLFVSWFHYKQSIAASSFWGIEGGYLDYSSFDTSNAQEDEALPLNKNREISISPFWESELDNRLTLLLKLPLSKFEMDTTADDYNSAGFDLSLIKKYHEKSELQVTLATEQQHYIEGEVPDLDGNLTQDTKLRLTLNKLTLQNRHYSGEQAEWEINSEIEAVVQKDNGPGYYNYSGLGIKESLNHYINSWKIFGTGELGIIQYSERAADSTSKKSEKMFVRTINVGLGLEKRFNKSLSVQAEYKKYQSQSNNDAEDFSTDLIQATTSFLF